MEPEWKYKAFNELAVEELYAILQLRNEVFVLEQNCVYQDVDNKDAGSFHLCGWHNKQLVAYCRVLPPGLTFNDASIGRVVTAPAFRRAGFGKVLMSRAIGITLQQFSCSKITIGAQLYLKAFYESLGFEQCRQPYLEDDIPHIHMLFTA